MLTGWGVCISPQTQFGFLLRPILCIKLPYRPYPERMGLSKTLSRRFRSQPGGLFEGNGMNCFSWWVESIQRCHHLPFGLREETFSVLLLTSECILNDSGALLLSLVSSSGFVATDCVKHVAFWDSAVAQVHDVFIPQQVAGNNST